MLIVPRSWPALKSRCKSLQRESPCKALAELGKAALCHTISHVLTNPSKSQLAIQYSHQLRVLDPKTWVFWLSADSTANFEKGFAEIADKADIAAYYKGNKDRLLTVKRWLEDESNGKWLIIVDNADDLTVLIPGPPTQTKKKSKTAMIGNRAAKNMLDLLPQTLNGRYLVTSRDREVAYQITGDYKSIIPVSEFNETEALELLHKRLIEIPEKSEAKELVKAVGYMPLAITHAAGSIEQGRPRMTIPKYIEKFRKGDSERTQLLEADVYDPRRDRHRSNSVFVTWHISFEMIRETRPSAARLLSLMSLFNRHAIPEDLLLDRYMQDVVPETPWWKTKRYTRRMNKGPVGRKRYAGKSKNGETQPDFEDDWSLLNRFSLISTDISGTHFSMNNLVQVATRRWLELHAQLSAWNRNFIFLMNDVYPNIRTDYDVLRKTCEALFPHALAASQCEPPDKQTLHVWAHLLYKIGEHTYDLTAWDFGIKVLGAASTIFEASRGKCDDLTLLSMWRMSEMLVLEKRHAEAEVHYRTVLKRRKKSFGPSHLETLATMDELREVLNSQGKVTEADALYEESMAIRERKYGLHHKATQRAMEERVMFLSAKGRNTEAEKLARHAFTMRQEEAHHEVYDGAWCTNMESMALKLQLLRGEPEEATRIFREILEHKERTLGNKDTETLFTLIRLAAVFLGQEKYGDAEILYKRALSGDHEGKVVDLARRCEYVWCLLKQEKLEEAEPFAHALLQQSIKELGRADRNTAFASSILAGVLQGKNRLEEALQYVLEAYAIAREVLGEDHEDTQDYAQQLETIKHDIVAEKKIPASSVSSSGHVSHALNKIRKDSAHANNFAHFANGALDFDARMEISTNELAPVQGSCKEEKDGWCEKSADKKFVDTAVVQGGQGVCLIVD